MKMNKKLLLLTSMVILFPILWGLIIWPQLPNQIPIHFNVAGQANNFQSKALAVFGLPFFLLLVHLFVIFMIGRDPKNRTMNEKMVKVIYWLIPIVSLSVFYLIYNKALGSTTNPSVFVSVLLGLIFVIMGNYMPKLKVNHTVGIRLPWTLQSEDNWHKTHPLGREVVGPRRFDPSTGSRPSVCRSLCNGDRHPHHCVYPSDVLLSIKSEKSLV